MKYIYSILFFVPFLLLANWEEDVASIDNNTWDTAKWTKLSYQELELLNTAVEPFSNSLDIRLNHQIYDGQSVYFYRGEPLPNGLQGIANKYDIVKDNTMGYNTYVISRQFGLSNKTQLDLNTTNADGFIDYEFSMKNVNTVDSTLFDDQNAGVTSMFNNTETAGSVKDIVNRVAVNVNGYFNKTYDDYTFFELDLSGLGEILSGVNILQSNPFQNYVFRCNLVPDPLNNPFLYSLYVALDNFYNVYYGRFLIQICFSVYMCMLLWHKFINVFDID